MQGSTEFEHINIDKSEPVVLVTGVGGQLGYDVANQLLSRGYKVIGTDIKDHLSDITSDNYTYTRLDVTDKNAVAHAISMAQPCAVIHCAAWTNVDGAEDAGAIVWDINATGTENIAMACHSIGSKMVYISTDYVFDGQGCEPYLPDSKNFGPTNVYGRSKLAGEMAVSKLLSKYYIVRTAWVFGEHGGNFVNTMLKLGSTKSELCIVDDQIGTPTYTKDLARLICDLIKTELYGYYHATNEGGYISWYEFACEIMKQAGLGTVLHPVSTKEYGLSKANRPLNSRLDKSKLVEVGLEPLPNWKDALSRYLKNIM